jgi:hypothetical protein
MLTEQEILTKWWLTIDNIVNIITFEKDFTNFIKDVQQGYIIKRWLTEWNEVKLMWWIEACDDILNRLLQLEDARKQYFENEKKKELEKINEQLSKKSKR